MEEWEKRHDCLKELTEELNFHDHENLSLEHQVHKWAFSNFPNPFSYCNLLTFNFRTWCSYWFLLLVRMKLLNIHFLFPTNAENYPTFMKWLYRESVSSISHFRHIPKDQPPVYAGGLSTMRLNFTCFNQCNIHPIDECQLLAFRGSGRDTSGRI